MRYWAWCDGHFLFGVELKTWTKLFAVLYCRNGSRSGAKQHFIHRADVQSILIHTQNISEWWRHRSSMAKRPCQLEHVSRLLRKVQNTRKSPIMLWNCMQDEHAGATRMQRDVSQARLEAPERLQHTAKTHCLRGISTPWKHTCSKWEALTLWSMSLKMSTRLRGMGSVRLAHLVRECYLKVYPVLSPCATSERGKCLGGALHFMSTDSSRPNSLSWGTTRPARGVADMASSLRMGQMVKGVKDVYVVAQKLHDQVWSARSVPLSTPTSAICVR